MSYPNFLFHIQEDVLIEYFSLSSEDIKLIQRLRSDKNKLGFAVLLKSFQHLGYPPLEKKQIPIEVVELVASQLALPHEVFQGYRWKGRVFKYHLAIIREYTGFRPCQPNEKGIISKWLINHGYEHHSRKEFLEAAVGKFREMKIELPAENKFKRLVKSSRQQFFNSLYRQVAGRLDDAAREAMDTSIKPTGGESSSLEWVKTPPAKTGMKTILTEIEKLKYIRRFQIDRDVHFAGISDDLINSLADRARAEGIFQIRRHPPAVRYTLLAALAYILGADITDNIIKIFLQLIRRIEKKADKTLEKELISEIKRVYGKRQILYQVALAVTENPDGIVRDVVYPVVGESVFQRLIEELEGSESHYNLSRAKVMKKKYGGHYRRMMKPILDALVFRANNPAYQPALKGINLLHKYIDTRLVYYPEDEAIPDNLLKKRWVELVIESGPQGPRINKLYFELCVLGLLERGLKCREIWVEGAYRYRNPDRDLPADWPQNRSNYFRKLHIPEKPSEFIEPIRAEMIAGLEAANRYLSKKQEIYIYHPGGGERGLIRIPRIQKQPERSTIQEIKERVIKKWGILDLLDILIEADRQIDFLRSFYTSGQRQVLSQMAARERLILNLFSLGTNTELKRLHAASNPECSYDDLLYFRKRFIRIPLVREAIAALTNRILAIRNHKIWGRATTCASDAKHLGAWNQNLMAEWNPYYRKPGVMAYWHVERNALCIYSQLTTCGASQVAPMIEGLVRHDTEMRVEKNFVDSHGQSEVAFPFCRFLWVDLIPRLRRIKYERLYLPDQEMAGNLQHLKGILARPIRWDRGYEQYDEMVRHVVAVAEAMGPTESILWRFNSRNRSNPLYKAFIELGKALKTIHLCREITSADLRHERHEALNVIENFNAANEFICYGRQGELQTNDPEIQQLTILCLHLLQNAVILANTLMMERVFEQEAFEKRMEREDYRALTPLFTSNINPYGVFTVDFDKPSFLMAA